MRNRLPKAELRQEMMRDDSTSPPLQGIAAPQQQMTMKTMARDQVMPCSPSTQQVAPQIAVIGYSSDGNDNNAEDLTGSMGSTALFTGTTVGTDFLAQSGSSHMLTYFKRNKKSTSQPPEPGTHSGFDLEKVQNPRRYRCKFSYSGCRMYFANENKIRHEETCRFRPLACPCPGASCKWQGSLTDVMDHLKKVHKSITTLQGEDVVFHAKDINVPSAVDWVMMQSCYNRNFMLVLEKRISDDAQERFYAVVHLLGEKQEADNFLYELELSASPRILSWETTPRSIYEIESFAVHHLDSVLFGSSVAQFFAENNGIEVKLRISPRDATRKQPMRSKAGVIVRRVDIAVMPCSPSTQQVAPQIAVIGYSSDGNYNNAELLAVFECPVCVHYMLPPYLQCHLGHLVCGSCLPKLQFCPLCRGPAPNVRIRILEEIVNTVRFPCKFLSSGCGRYFFHQDKIKHEETCKYRPYCCPCPGESCEFHGSLTDVVNHLRKDHRHISILEDVEEMYEEMYM